MSMFDPYSHTRLHELRQEQLARKVRFRRQVNAESTPELFGQQSLPAIVQALTNRVARRKPEGSAPLPSARPALDS